MKKIALIIILSAGMVFFVSEVVGAAEKQGRRVIKEKWVSLVNGQPVDEKERTVEEVIPIKYVYRQIKVPEETEKYQVVKGDTLDALAVRFGTQRQVLLALNPKISDPNLIYRGQIIRVPITFEETREGKLLVANKELSSSNLALAEEARVLSEELIFAKKKLAEVDQLIASVRNELDLTKDRVTVSLAEKKAAEEKAAKIESKKEELTNYLIWLAVLFVVFIILITSVFVWLVSSAKKMLRMTKELKTYLENSRCRYEKGGFPSGAEAVLL